MSVKIKAFYETSFGTFTDNLKEKIKNEIEGKGKKYILSVDEEVFKKYLINKYSYVPIKIDYDSELIEEPTITKEFSLDRLTTDKLQKEVYNFTVRYNFTGSCELFKVQPKQYSLTWLEIYVSEQNETVSFKFKVYEKDPIKFIKVKDEHKKKAFFNLNNLNRDIENFVKTLPNIVSLTFQQIKNKHLQENDFFAAINVKVNENTTTVFTAPTIKKKNIPHPTVSNYKEFSSEPRMAKEMFEDVLKVTYELGKSMEKKPSTYSNKDEEGIRDQFLLILETRYEGTTATGETFNKGGKTDIILKYSKDGSNLFVAECKFWHGAAEFHKAISQLFDKYLTWRDSKAALLLFVTNKDFSNVLEIIKKEAIKNPYFIKSVGKRGETSFSFQFHLPHDKNKIVYFEIIAFHFIPKAINKL